MVNIRISLRIGEIKEMSNTIHSCILSSYEKLNYIDFYNLKSLMKKLFDKVYRWSNGSRTQKATIVNFNINEYDSLERLFDLSITYLSGKEFVYSMAIFQEIFKQAIRQIENLQRMKKLN